MIKLPEKKRFTLKSVQTLKPVVKDDPIDYIEDIDNYTTQEINDNIEANRWWLEILLTIGTTEEVKEYLSTTSLPYFRDKAIAKLESSLKLKLDTICATVNYLEIKEDYQLDNTLRLFNNEQAIAIGDYENYLIIASENHCHVIDVKKFALDKIHKLFVNGKVNVFYKAEQTLSFIKGQKILMTNNIFDVTSAYKLLWGEQMTEEEINEKIDTQLGNLPDKDKAIKKTQYLLKVRAELRKEIIDKKLIDKAKEVFKSLAESFTISSDILDLATTLKKAFDGDIIQVTNKAVLS